MFETVILFYFLKGDLILGETSAKFEELSDYMNSLKKVMRFKADVIYPGHGPVVKDASARIQQYIDHRSKRNEQILQVLRTTPGKFYEADEIVRVVYQVRFVFFFLLS
jgi:glyoxylase-like metal-dependent hydrolase (beta-lactamase superfamily II)